MKCKLFVAAQSIIVDFSSKRATAINLLEDMVSIGFPLLLQLSTIAFFERETTESDEVFYMEAKLGETIVMPRYKLDIHIDEESKGAKNLVNIGALIIPEPGIFTISIMNDQNDIQLSISINILTNTQQASIPIQPAEYVS
jgi:hypothetical protein